ncbi:hypothetical protein [Sphingomonas sp. Leaf208]|nr:hypothetical protein [Sphingomonas sp. Leaf208]
MATIDNQVCRVTAFVPFAKMEHGNAVGRSGFTPYAFVHLD